MCECGTTLDKRVKWAVSTLTPPVGSFSIPLPACRPDLPIYGHFISFYKLPNVYLVSSVCLFCLFVCLFVCFACCFCCVLRCCSALLLPSKNTNFLITFCVDHKTHFGLLKFKHFWLHNASSRQDKCKKGQQAYPSCPLPPASSAV